MCLQGHEEMCCEALEVVIQIHVVLQLQKQSPPWELAVFGLMRTVLDVGGGSVWWRRNGC